MQEYYKVGGKGAPRLPRQLRHLLGGDELPPLPSRGRVREAGAEGAGGGQRRGKGGEEVGVVVEDDGLPQDGAARVPVQR